MNGRDIHETSAVGQVLEPFVHEPRVAYFSMEIALRKEIPTFAGGLGVLAGDTVRSAADLEVPLVAVTVASRAGYFRQGLNAQGQQSEQPQNWEPEHWTVPLKAKIAVHIGGRDVWIRAFLYVVSGHMNGRIPVVFLDTELPENHPDDRTLTYHLYGGDEAYRLALEMVLGFGGVRMLQALGFKVRQYHMNEGHAAFLVLELLRQHAYLSSEIRPGESRYDLPRVRDLCNFTTHTPVEAGHDQFPYSLVEKVMGEFADWDILRRLAGDNLLNMTRLALNSSEYINGVAKRHAETSRHLFPGYQVSYITNGIHAQTWASRSFAELYDRHFPGWTRDPELLINADRIPDDAVWDAHVNEKAHLIEYVAHAAGVQLDPEVFTVGYARRMTAYKRPDLIFEDIERLKRIAQTHPLQFVFAGKAHPRDQAGKHMIERIFAAMAQLEGIVPVVFLEDYNLDTAARMVAGVDLWLNTPLAPREASGTSGMKAALNGVPNFSALDGWWVEGWIEGVTGWAIEGAGSGRRAEVESLYHKLADTIAPLYYGQRAGWITVMKGAICRNGALFNSHRMMRRYVTEAYIH